MTDLEALALRCEGAGSADRELDAAFAHLTGLRVVDEGHPLGRCCYDAGGRLTTLPSFTASLDAAMTLVPEGLRLMLSEWDDEQHLRAKGAWQAVLSEPGCDSSFDAMRGYRCDHAATPALALCAAALRARALSPDKDQAA